MVQGSHAAAATAACFPLVSLKQPFNCPRQPCSIRPVAVCFASSILNCHLPKRHCRHFISSRLAVWRAVCASSLRHASHLTRSRPVVLKRRSTSCNQAQRGTIGIQSNIGPMCRILLLTMSGSPSGIHGGRGLARRHLSATVPTVSDCKFLISSGLNARRHAADLQPVAECQK